MQPPPKAFTTSYNGISRVLQNEVHIAEAFNPSSITGTISPASRGGIKYSAIWDTGATNTIITRKVVSKLGLKQIGVTQLETANDKKHSPHNRHSYQYSG
ncbi:MAG: hypothetical protein CMI54_02875 [Parcubacteria group bacterium]|nr:hypothetical protein [Parcubacteria group bacterium]